MSSDFKKILSHLSKDIEQEKLLQYLNEHLSAAEEHEVEMQLSDDPFLDDAMEGLQQVKAKNNLPLTLHQLNKNLLLQIKKTKIRRQQSFSFQQPWIYYCIIILLIICIVGYLVIKRFG